MSDKKNCPHTETGSTGQICVHLLEYFETRQPQSGDDYIQCFTGKGREYIRLCPKCAYAPEMDYRSIKTFCTGCLEEVEKELYWEGTTGTPGITERKSNLSLSHGIHRIPGLDLNNILAIQPLDNSGQCECIALTTSGKIIKINFDRDFVEELFEFRPDNFTLQYKGSHAQTRINSQDVTISYI